MPKVSEDVAKPKQRNKEEPVTIYYILNSTLSNKNIPSCRGCIEINNETSSVYCITKNDYNKKRKD